MEEQTFEYEHQAMATYFKLVIYNEEEHYAISAADQVFRLIDDMEKRLSRFIPDSEISHINKMREGDQLPLDFETWEVMKLSFQAHQISGGTFDIGVAKHMDIFRATKQGILNEFEMHNALQKEQTRKSQAAFYLDPDKPLIICGQAGMQFDLGGIGKGYVVDAVKKHLLEMDIQTFSVSAGDSTLLLCNNKAVMPFFKYPISAKYEQRILKLDNVTVSASGTYYQGKHIFDPRTGENDFDSPYSMTWVAATNAAISDAMATAAFLLNPEEMVECVANTEEIIWMAYAKDGKLHFVGKNGLNSSI